MKWMALVLALALVLPACSKKRLTTRKLPKNPPSFPTRPDGTTDPKASREPVAGFIVTSSFNAALESRGIVLSNVCLQLAQVKNDGQDVGLFLEISDVPCPSTGLVDDASVLRRIKAVQDTRYATNWRLIVEESYRPEIGTVHKFDDGGNAEMRLEGLCDIDTMSESRGWKDYCEIAVDHTAFAKPEPLNFFNLD